MTLEGSNPFQVAVIRTCGCDGIGSLPSLRSWGPKGRVGSNPTTRTIIKELRWSLLIMGLSNGVTGFPCKEAV